MSSYTIAMAPEPPEAPLQDLFDQWSEGYEIETFIEEVGDDAQAEEVWEGGHGAETLIWGEARNVGVWGEGIRFDFVCHRVKIKTMRTRDGPRHWLIPSYEHAEVFMSIQEDEIVTFMAGTNASMRAARIRVGRRLNPERRQAWLRVVKPSSAEIYAIEDADTAEASDIQTTGLRRGDDINRVVISGPGVADTRLQPHLNYETRYRAEFISQFLTEEVDEDDPVRVSINGESGLISARGASDETMHRYVQDVVLPVLRQERGRLAYNNLL